MWLSFFEMEINYIDINIKNINFHIDISEIYVILRL